MSKNMLYFLGILIIFVVYLTTLLRELQKITKIYQFLYFHTILYRNVGSHSGNDSYSFKPLQTPASTPKNFADSDTLILISFRVIGWDKCLAKWEEGVAKYHPTEKWEKVLNLSLKTPFFKSAFLPKIEQFSSKIDLCWIIQSF